MRDRDAYTDESPAIAGPEAIVVSGDLIRGVSLNTANYESELIKQYAVAENFSIISRSDLWPATVRA